MNKIIYSNMADHLKYIDYLRGKKDVVRSLTDQLPVGIYRTTPDGKILYANPALARMLEYSTDEIYKLTVSDLYADEELRNEEIKIFQSISSDTSSKEILLKTKSGKLIIVKDTVNIIRNRKGNVKYFDGVLEDITAQKKAEREILQLMAAIKQSPVSIVITGLDGKIEYVNPKFTDVTGYTYDEAIGKNPNILKTEHTKSEDYKEMWEIISAGKTWRGEFLNKRKDGSLYWELASISPIIDDNGKIIKYVAVKEDITARKATEDALIISEKELKEANATKNMFFSIIAHDLKGPLGSFVQLLQLFKDNFNEISNEEKLDYLNILIGLSNKTNNLLEDLLLWSRIQMNSIDFSVQNVKLIDLANEAVDQLSQKAKEKNIQIEVEINNKLQVCVNANSVITVIRNILSNAIKFSHSESTVKINARLKEKDVIIAIQDNGLGIPEENINKLFKIETAFSTYGTNKEKGTGLGLILCKELIQKNGGKIWLQSKENEGTTIYFSLPLEK
ncbi:MAG TPA: PAS domain-containing sensor histidine kinase [Bacteroidales bacterium]|nr:PAS domain-containing sensor histidine kinase [Bacteroidales bacterium]